MESGIRLGPPTRELTPSAACSTRLHGRGSVLQGSPKLGRGSNRTSRRTVPVRGLLIIRALVLASTHFTVIFATVSMKEKEVRFKGSLGWHEEPPFGDTGTYLGCSDERPALYCALGGAGEQSPGALPRIGRFSLNETEGLASVWQESSQCWQDTENLILPKTIVWSSLSLV